MVQTGERVKVECFKVNNNFLVDIFRSTLKIDLYGKILRFILAYVSEVIKEMCQEL